MCGQQFLKYNIIICSVTIMGIMIISNLDDNDSQEDLTPLQILHKDLDCQKFNHAYQNIQQELEINNKQFDIHFSNAKWDDTEIIAKRQVCLAQQIYGPKSTSYALYLNQLGLVYTQTGQLKEAMYYISECLQIEEYQLEDDSENLLMHWNNLAIIYKKRKQFETAIEILNDIIPHIKKKNEFSINLALLYNNLAECFKSNHLQAIKYAEQAVNIFDELKVYDNVNYPIILTTLAIMYNQVDPNKSIELLQEALKVGRLIYNFNHPINEGTIKNLCQMKQIQYCNEDL